MAEEVIEIWESREVWLRVASMWSVTHSQASYNCLTERTWNVMPKICGQIAARCKSGDSTVCLAGSRDGWAILTGFLSNVQWGQVLNRHGGQVFATKDKQWAGETGHKLVLGTTICESFKETT